MCYLQAPTEPALGNIEFQPIHPLSIQDLIKIGDYAKSVGIEACPPEQLCAAVVITDEQLTLPELLERYPHHPQVKELQRRVKHGRSKAMSSSSAWDVFRGKL